MFIVGHRGAKKEAPENTIEGFQYAWEAGVRHVELDVRTCADNTLVLIHDKTLERTTGHSGRVSETSFSEIRGLNAAADFAGWQGSATIASLENLFHDCPPFESYQLEVKTDRFSRLDKLTDNLVRKVYEWGVQDRVIVTSIDFRVPWLVRKKAPGIKRGYVLERRSSLAVSRLLHQDWLCIHWPLCTTKLGEQCRKQNRHLSVWTVNEVEAAKTIRKMGAYSLITDIPATMLEHFPG